MPCRPPQPYVQMINFLATRATQLAGVEHPQAGINSTVVSSAEAQQQCVLQDLRDDERVRPQLNAALNAMHGSGTSAAQPQQQQQGQGGGAPSAAAPPAPDPTAASRWGAAAEDEDFTLRQLVRVLEISRVLGRRRSHCS